MATEIQLKHEQTGIIKKGFYGFSWTTLFFGFFPSLFRGDFITFLGGTIIATIVAFPTWGIGWLAVSLVWAFMYNSYYTKKLIEKGYVFNGLEDENLAAATALGVPYERLIDKLSGSMEFRKYQGNKNLDEDSYKIYLSEKYEIKKSDVFEKYIVKDSMFEKLEDALTFAAKLDEEINASETSLEEYKNRINDAFIVDALNFGTPAQVAGVQVRDCIIGYNRSAVFDGESLDRAVSSANEEHCAIKVLRAEKVFSLKIKNGKLGVAGRDIKLSDAQVGVRLQDLTGSI
jgi:hypothetical protein